MISRILIQQTRQVKSYKKTRLKSEINTTMHPKQASTASENKEMPLPLATPNRITQRTKSKPN
jgi:hypothetical protein